MSTSYYFLAKPFTAILIKSSGVKDDDEITFHVQFKKAGTLKVSKENSKLIYQIISHYEEDKKCPMRTYWGGNKVGIVVKENVPNLSNEMILISENGDIVTVGEIRVLKGTKRRIDLYGKEYVVKNGARH